MLRTQLSWKLDYAKHPSIGSPFSSVFIPDFTAGLRAVAGSPESLLSHKFLSGYASYVDPSVSPFVNETQNLRKSDLESIIFKAKSTGTGGNQSSGYSRLSGSERYACLWPYHPKAPMGALDWVSVSRG